MAGLGSRRWGHTRWLAALLGRRHLCGSEGSKCRWLQWKPPPLSSRARLVLLLRKIKRGLRLRWPLRPACRAQPIPRAGSASAFCELTCGAAPLLSVPPASPTFRCLLPAPHRAPGEPLQTLSLSLSWCCPCRPSYFAAGGDTPK